jgi:dolichyl-phosphate-mannose-protein mannosyltransferase
MTSPPASPLSGRLREGASRHAFAILLGAGLALRFAIAYIIFPDQGFAGDLRYHESWMGVLARVGPGGFYANVSDALPPVFTWILWPLGVLADLISRATGVSVGHVDAALVKLPAIVADALVAAVLYRAVGGWIGRRAGLIAAGLFLVIPVTWYESALWGQIDSIPTLFSLAALVLLVDGRSEAATAAAVTGTLVKPQFGIVLLVVGVILLRRHLFLPGSSPGRSRVTSPGPIRLVTSALVGLMVALVIVLPFDIAQRAPPDLARIPLVGQAAGLLVLMQVELSQSNPLTANAYNPWALVGPEPLAARGLSHWTPDSIHPVDAVSAFSIGLVLVLGAFGLAGWQLLRRDDRASIFLASTVLVVAVFILPTRVHERYVYPAFALAAPLAATSRAWRTWYLVLGLANLANLHAVLTHGGTSGMVNLPLGDVVRSEPVVVAIVLVQTAAFVWAAWQIRPRSRDSTAGRRALRSYRLRCTHEGGSLSDVENHGEEHGDGEQPAR